MRKFLYLALLFAALGCTNEENKIPEEFDFGVTESGIYKNAYFDMEIAFDSNWVIQDKKQINALLDTGKDLIIGDDENLKAVVEAAEVNSAYLLTIFKHEVGAAVDFNPSLIVIAENTKNAPGIKTGEDYLFHTKKLLSQTQMEYYFEKDVYEKTIGRSTFHVMQAKLDYLDQTIIQEYITTVTKNFSLSFIVSYTTEEERNELYEVIDNIKL